MTRKSKPKSTCGLCKPHKYWGNSKERDKHSVRKAKEKADPKAED